ncbi:MAG: hypothetical protein KDD48_05880 [Bdellovibrionales bacterium]|nr:hypothetical protein [Bdellovibrionales bacterium]
MKKSNTPGQTLSRFLGLILQGNRQFVWTILFYGLLVSLLSLAVPVSVQAIVNTIAFTSLSQQLVVISILLFIVLLGAGVFQVLQAWLIDLFHRKIFAQLGVEVTKRLYLAKSQFFRMQNAPELVNRFFDVFTVQKSVSILFTDGFSLVLQLLVGLTLIALYHPLLLLYDIFLICSLALAWFLFGAKAMDSAILESKAKYSLINWLEEQGRSYKLLASSRAEAMVMNRSEFLISKYISYRKQHFNHLLGQIIILVSTYAISSAILLGLGGYLVIKNQLSLGQLVAAEIIITGILVKIAKSGKYLEVYYDLVAASEKLLHLFDFDIVELSSIDTETFNKVDIQCRDIYAQQETRVFRYTEMIPFKSRYFFRVNHAACKEILLDKIFGESISTKGSVFINQRSSDLINIQQLRSLIYTTGYPTIIEGTIAENLTLGDPHLSEKDIYDVLNLVELATSIEGLPDGQKTQMLPGGHPLWQSQLLRFDIARAILLRFKIIILNESFQSIGVDRQEKILRYLTSAERDWTLLQFGDQPKQGIEYDKVETIGWVERSI